MPMASILLKPGVNTERTPALNEAGVSQSQLLRYKDQLLQTYGGWESIFTTNPSTVKDMHAWQDIVADDWLAVGGTTNLTVMASAGTQTITPQQRTTNPAPNFSISSGTTIVTIVDANSGPSTFNTVFFNTPVSIGNLLLNGAYPVVSVLSSASYTIASSVSASTTISSSGKVPFFTTSSGSANVLVDLSNNNFPMTLGLQQSFRAPTTVGGVTISGPYSISSIIDSTRFSINANTLATSSTTAFMNSGNAQLVYYITIGPQSAGSGFGAGGFGDGGFGSGSATSGDPGTPITATNWSMDNWGEILLACPYNGAIYTWSPDSGFQMITRELFPSSGCTQ